MSRRADRKAPEVRIGGPGVPVKDFWRIWADDTVPPSTDETRQKDDGLRLVPGASVNGQSPLIRRGEETALVCVVRCGSCRVVVAQVRETDTGVRYVDTLVLTDRDARPVVLHVVRQKLTRSARASIPVDCQGHGRQVLALAPLLRELRKKHNKVLTYRVSV